MYLSKLTECISGKKYSDRVKGSLSSRLFILPNGSACVPEAPTGPWMGRPLREQRHTVLREGLLWLTLFMVFSESPRPPDDAL